MHSIQISVGMAMGTRHGEQQYRKPSTSDSLKLMGKFVMLHEADNQGQNERRPNACAPSDL